MLTKGLGKGERRVHQLLVAWNGCRIQPTATTTPAANHITCKLKNVFRHSEWDEKKRIIRQQGPRELEMNGITARHTNGVYPHGVLHTQEKKHF